MIKLSHIAYIIKGGIKPFFEGLHGIGMYREKVLVTTLSWNWSSIPLIALQTFGIELEEISIAFVFWHAPGLAHQYHLIWMDLNPFCYF